MTPRTTLPPRLLVALLVPLLVLNGCDLSTGPAPPEEPLTELPRALSGEELEVIRASNGFAFDILRETVRRDDAPNIFLSPLSASMALGMTMNGARGATLDGMRDALDFSGLEMDDINASYRDVIELLRGLDRGVDTRIANSIWALDDFPFHDHFFETVSHYFDAEVGTLDSGSPDAAPTINRWVEEKTEGRITEIVPNPIPDEIVMYLINAIYFKGEWRHRFDPADTRDAPFTLADGSTRSVKMMHRTGSVRAGSASEGRILELSYGRDAYAMTIVLPDPDQEIDEIIEGLDAERWQEWTEGLSEGELPVGLPRFRLEYETTMNDALVALGMESAFAQVPGTDFTGMSPLGEELFISDVVQKTFVDVNEEGTEAAAATSVGIGVTSAPEPIIVDRPFIVAIRERLSGTILFLGKVGEPESR